MQQSDASTIAAAIFSSLRNTQHLLTDMHGKQVYNDSPECDYVEVPTAGGRRIIFGKTHKSKPAQTAQPNRGFMSPIAGIF